MFKLYFPKYLYIAVYYKWQAVFEYQIIKYINNRV